MISSPCRIFGDGTWSPPGGRGGAGGRAGPNRETRCVLSWGRRTAIWCTCVTVQRNATRRWRQHFRSSRWAWTARAMGRIAAPLRTPQCVWWAHTLNASRCSRLPSSNPARTFLDSRAAGGRLQLQCGVDRRDVSGASAHAEQLPSSNRRRGFLDVPVVTMWRLTKRLERPVWRLTRPRRRPAQLFPHKRLKKAFIASRWLTPPPASRARATPLARGSFPTGACTLARCTARCGTARGPAPRQSSFSGGATWPVSTSAHRPTTTRCASRSSTTSGRRWWIPQTLSTIRTGSSRW